MYLVDVVGGARADLSPLFKVSFRGVPGQGHVLNLPFSEFLQENLDAAGQTLHYLQFFFNTEQLSTTNTKVILADLHLRVWEHKMYSQDIAWQLTA